MLSGTHWACFFSLVASLALWATVPLDIRRRSRESARFAHIRELRHR
jgi:hypothetical protein